jgi:hypothetical protein
VEAVNQVEEEECSNLPGRRADRSGLAALIGQVVAFAFDMGDAPRGLLPFAKDHHVFVAVRINLLVTAATKFDFGHYLLRETILLKVASPIVFRRMFAFKPAITITRF